MSKLFPSLQDIDGSGLRFCIIAARFNYKIGQELIKGAKEELLKHNVSEEDIDLLTVPGSLEIPFACQLAIKNNTYDALITVGVVIKGDTPHFDLVCRGYLEGTMNVSLNFNIPITYGVITAENEEQARDRAGGSIGNKGVEAAYAALEMAVLNNKYRATN